MSVVIVLAMHGMPPRDFPRAEMEEYFRQYDPFHHGGPPSSQGPAHGDHGHGHPHGSAAHEGSGPSRMAELEHKMRHWPRTPQNDSFFGAAHRLADCLKDATGHSVVVGFNEFCAPDMDEAFDQAVAQKAQTVVVITPMMTPGGIHSEVDIPQTIQRARQRHSQVRFEYIWPLISGMSPDSSKDRLLKNWKRANRKLWTWLGGVP